MNGFFSREQYGGSGVGCGLVTESLEGQFRFCFPENLIFVLQNLAENSSYPSLVSLPPVSPRPCARSSAAQNLAEKKAHPPSPRGWSHSLPSHRARARAYARSMRGPRSLCIATPALRVSGEYERSRSYRILLLSSHLFSQGITLFGFQLCGFAWYFDFHLILQAAIDVFSEFTSSTSHETKI